MPFRTFLRERALSSAPSITSDRAGTSASASPRRPPPSSGGQQNGDGFDALLDAGAAPPLAPAVLPKTTQQGAASGGPSAPSSEQTGTGTENGNGNSTASASSGKKSNSSTPNPTASPAAVGTAKTSTTAGKENAAAIFAALLPDTAPVAGAGPGANIPANAAAAPQQPGTEQIADTALTVAADANVAAGANVVNSTAAPAGPVPAGKPNASNGDDEDGSPDPGIAVSVSQPVPQAPPAAIIITASGDGAIAATAAATAPASQTIIDGSSNARIKPTLVADQTPATPGGNGTTTAKFAGALAQSGAAETVSGQPTGASTAPPHTPAAPLASGKLASTGQNPADPKAIDAEAAAPDAIANNNIANNNTGMSAPITLGAQGGADRSGNTAPPSLQASAPQNASNAPAVTATGFIVAAANPANSHSVIAPAPSALAAAVPIAGLPITIATRALAGSNEFDIRLDPPELGRIEVRLAVDHNGQVTSHVTVDRADTLQLLQSQQSQLERALEQAGLKTADNGLQFTLRDQSFAGQNNSGQQNGTPMVVPDAELPTVETTQVYSRTRFGSGSLDIRV